MSGVQTVEAIIPELRFSAFGEHWKKSELADIASIQRGRFSPRPRNNPIYYGGEIPFVQTSDVVNSGGRIRSFTQTLNEKGLKVSKLFPKGTILITIAANIGYTGVLQIDMACPDSLVGISCNPEVHNYFLDYLLQKEQPRMDYLAVEAAQKNINIGFLEIYVLTLPTLPEQRKIADFLMAVDRRIGQLLQKKALLEDYKKGVMQQLFTQAIRFKNKVNGEAREGALGCDHGNDFPDWEEKKLGELCSILKGKRISKAEVAEGGATPCIRYGELYTEYSELIQEPKSKTDVPTKELVLSIANDVIIPASGETHIDIATASCVMSEGVALGGDLNIIRTKLNGVFLAYYLNNACKHAIASVAQGSSVIHLYPDQLKGLALAFPSTDEQTKIADFLSAIDRKIESVATQITETQTFKRGLLQQMFV